MRVKLVQLDGKLPNIALMKLAHWHRERGDEVILSRTVQPNLFEPHDSGAVYGSAIFKKSAPMARMLREVHPGAVVGGTGSGEPLGHTVEQQLGVERYEHYDYGIYPEYPWSIGFTQRGCRRSCSCCVAPRKEGKPVALNTIHDIWRPDRHRSVVLLDHDFFGQPRECWEARIEELREGDFRVNFSQGINVREITEETAQAAASVRYCSSSFSRRRLHTDWWRRPGSRPSHLMVHMLVGYDPKETMERVLHRYRRITERGCHAYPMVYDEVPDDGDNGRESARARMREANPERPAVAQLRVFQRWVIQRYSEFIPWEEFQAGENRNSHSRQPRVWTAPLIAAEPAPAANPGEASGP